MTIRLTILVLISVVGIGCGGMPVMESIADVEQALDKHELMKQPDLTYFEEPELVHADAGFQSLIRPDGYTWEEIALEGQKPQTWVGPIVIYFYENPDDIPRGVEVLKTLRRDKGYKVYDEETQQETMESEGVAQGPQPECHRELHPNGVHITKICLAFEGNVLIHTMAYPEAGIGFRLLDEPALERMLDDLRDGVPD